MFQKNIPFKIKICNDKLRRKRLTLQSKKPKNDNIHQKLKKCYLTTFSLSLRLSQIFSPFSLTLTLLSGHNVNILLYRFSTTWVEEFWTTPGQDSTPRSLPTDRRAAARVGPFLGMASIKVKCKHEKLIYYSFQWNNTQRIRQHSGRWWVGFSALIASQLKTLKVVPTAAMSDARY